MGTMSLFSGLILHSVRALLVSMLQPKLVLNQAADFDLARALSDRSRRSLPCDRSRRPAAHQTIPSETTLVTTGEQLPGHIAALVVPIVPAVQAAQTMSGDVMDNAVTANVRMVTAQVRTTAPILSAHVQKGALNVVGARYDLDSGAVTLIA